MLDYPPAIDRAPSRSGGAPSAGNTDCAQHIQACRAAYLAQAPGARLGALQTIELGRLRARMGRRWSELRDRVVGLVEQALARELGAGDLYVDSQADLLHVVRVGRGRAEVERHGELLAAELTARLWGTVPRGASLSVRTLPFDPGHLLHEAMTAADLRACLDACAQRQERPRGAAEGTMPAGLRARFQPILQLRKRLVSAYRLAACVGGAVFPAPPPDALAAELDEWGLRQALQLCREPSQDRVPALLLPVHYATLAGMRPRELFTQHCRLLPARSAQQLIFEVLDLPAGAPQARVRELMSYLRPFCLAIVVRLERANTNLDHLASSGIRGLSASAATLAGEGGCVAEALGFLAGSVRVHGMRSLLIDAATPGIYRMALAAGIDHIGGDGLMPPLARPGRAFLVG